MRRRNGAASVDKMFSSRASFHVQIAKSWKNVIKIPLEMQQSKHRLIRAQICSVHRYIEIKINAQLFINATQSRARAEEARKKPNKQTN